MPTVTNAGAQPIKWTLRRAASEFGVSIPTLVSKLNMSDQTSAEDKTFTTKQLTTALFGDVFAEKFRKLRAEREQTELETAILKGEFLNRVELENMFRQIAEAILQIIKASKLSRAEQDDLRRQISSIPIIIRDVARTQSRRSRNGDSDGDGTQPTRSPAKAKRGREPRAEESSAAKSRGECGGLGNLFP